MVFVNPSLAEPVADPGGVINKPPFEMGVANFLLAHKEISDARVLVIMGQGALN